MRCRKTAQTEVLSLPPEIDRQLHRRHTIDMKMVVVKRTVYPDRLIINFSVCEKEIYFYPI